MLLLGFYIKYIDMFIITVGSVMGVISQHEPGQPDL